MTSHEKRPLGKILLEQQLLTATGLDAALEAQARGGGRLASRLVEQGTLRANDVLRALCEQHGVPGIDLDAICIPLGDLDSFPREIAEVHQALPVAVREDRIVLAMADPGATKVIDELEFVTGKRVVPYVALAAALARVTTAAYEARLRGERFYVGPTCPPDTRARMGVHVDGSSPPPVPLAEGGELLPVDDDDVTEAALEEVTDDAVELLPESEDGSAVEPANGRRTVLVVDDDADIRRLIRRVLVDRGMRVIEAERGREALQLVKEHAPDLVVLDAMLPELHGFEVARRLRASSKFKHTPIVLVTAIYRGWRYAEDIRAAYGVSAYLEKPFRVPQLVEAVERALAGEGTPAAPATRVDTEPTTAEGGEALAAGLTAYRKGELDAAIDHFRKGALAEPRAFRLHLHLGLVLGKAGRVYEAIHALEAALDLDATSFSAQKNLAVLYQSAGFRNKAIEMWERALPHAPDEATRATVKERLLGLL